jgi:hypothetical protein
MNKNKDKVGSVTVVEAIKGRNSMKGPKKGVNLLSIVQKLTAKRKSKK